MSGKSRYSIIFFMFIFLSIFFSFGIIHAANNTAVFFVAPDGSDNNNGTEKKPFKTLMKARDAARKLKAEEPKKIIVRGGLYYEVELALGPEDSGLTIEAYPGEKPVLYGGRPITNWEKDGNFYSAKLEGVKDRTWDFRLLLVNNEMRPRARLPKTGEFKHLNIWHARWLGSTGRGWETQPTLKDLTTMKYHRGDIGPWLDIRNAELTTFNSWDETLVGLKSMDEDTQTVTFSITAGYPPGSFRFHEMIDGNIVNWQKGQTYIIWNVREGMHEPGQWYLDRTNEKLVYWPLPGEDISKINVLAPTKETVIDIKKDTKDLTLKGLVISCTKTPLIEYGAFKGAISGDGINNCRFIDLTVENVSGYGITNSGNNLLFEGCEIKYTGTGGVNIGGKNVTFTNNHIHDDGLIYPSGVALGIGTDNSRINHNEVHSTSYIGILCGGQGNILESNLVYDVMKELNDGGHFYIAGKDNIIRGNVALVAKGDEKRWEAAATRGEELFVWAYYMDKIATNCVFENNLAINTVRPTHMHWTANCTLRNNVFIDKGLQILTFPRSFGLTFENNILVAEEIWFQKPSDDVVEIKNNIIFSSLDIVTLEKVLIYTQVDLRPLKPSNGNVFADPMFVDWENGNFNFKPDSPALKLGIKPIDVSTAGIIKK